MDKSQYETHVAGEVVEWVDKNYNTVKDRSGRAISGLSMGGHGAPYLALKHQDVFGAAGSTSGGVDLRPFPKNWDIAKRIGTYAAQPQRWEEMSVIITLHLLEPGSLHPIVDCGTGDFSTWSIKICTRNCLTEIFRTSTQSGPVPTTGVLEQPGKVPDAVFQQRAGSGVGGNKRLKVVSRRP